MENSILNLPFILNVIGNILDPRIDSPYIECDAFKRKDAFLTFMNNSKDWLFEHEIQAADIIWDEWNELDCQNIPITKEVLVAYNNTIQEKCWRILLLRKCGHEKG